LGQPSGVATDLTDAHAVGYGGFPELVAHPIWESTDPIDMAKAAILNVDIPNVILLPDLTGTRSR
jgi:hypothetical protein